MRRHQPISAMPIYEFYCPNNHRIYSFFARSLAYSSKTPRCPDNPKHKMERMISSFSVTGRAKEKPDAPPGSEMDDARMDAAMAQMEREFSSMDSENPDPRQMAQMMRRMTSLTGEKMPGPMDEMLRRMEAGEDPERLEEEMGDVLGDEDAGGMPEAEEGLKARLRKLRGKPARDPVLYEMSEFVK